MVLYFFVLANLKPRVTFFQSTLCNWRFFIYQNKLLVEQRIEEKINEEPREEAVREVLYYEGDT